MAETVQSAAMVSAYPESSACGIVVCCKMCRQVCYDKPVPCWQEVGNRPVAYRNIDTVIPSVTPKALSRAHVHIRHHKPHHS